ncbi:YjcZ family sporulation protein [Evansella halocellulosilytica]|uniref:YjcZ family sporulation protein n=1 Tax=Evansella halocellulosilytica TaxID=2011013 RepID=UPI00387E64E4
MYGYGGGCCFDPCGVGGYGYGAPAYDHVAPAYAGPGRGFALIVVLFILLIIVGASKFGY